MAMIGVIEQKPPGQPESDLLVKSYQAIFYKRGAVTYAHYLMDQAQFVDAAKIFYVVTQDGTILKDQGNVDKMVHTFDGWRVPPSKVIP